VLQRVSTRDSSQSSTAKLSNPTNARSHGQKSYKHKANTELLPNSLRQLEWT
ncbi:Uncharacterized protein DAT39_015997, partial [Clarias magur]